MSDKHEGRLIKRSHCTKRKNCAVLPFVGDLTEGNVPEFDYSPFHGKSAHGSPFFVAIRFVWPTRTTLFKYTTDELRLACPV